jgi:hypothetical protein
MEEICCLAHLCFSEWKRETYFHLTFTRNRSLSKDYRHFPRLNKITDEGVRHLHKLRSRPYLSLSMFLKSLTEDCNCEDGNVQSLNLSACQMKVHNFFGKFKL